MIKNCFLKFYGVRVVFAVLALTQVNSVTALTNAEKEAVALFATSQSNVFTYTPYDLAQLRELLQGAKAQGQKVCLVGAGKSQGGQTLSTQKNNCRISLQNFDQILALDVQGKSVTVQAGIPWDRLQHMLAPHGLAVQAMQSYNDFSIGGSLSVNAHGQDIHVNPLIQSVKSCKVLLSNGELVTISRTENSELFNLVIGGYGLFGIIVEVTLALTDDVIFKQQTITINAHDLANYFLHVVKPNPAIECYSARLSLNSSALFEKALVVTYEKTDLVDPKLFVIKENPIRDFVVSKLLKLMEKNKLVKNLRFGFEEFALNKPSYISRNNFMHTTINSLPHNEKKTQYILQEYFIPYDRVNAFLSSLKQLVQQYGINVLNVTVRHVNADVESKLAYARQDCCAFVLYIAVENKPKVKNNIVRWSRKVIDHVLDCNGTYYLPYHLVGTREQLKRAYPNYSEFIALKKQYDPCGLFSNSLYEQYV